MRPAPDPTRALRARVAELEQALAEERGLRQHLRTEVTGPDRWSTIPPNSYEVFNLILHDSQHPSRARRDHMSNGKLLTPLLRVNSLVVYDCKSSNKFPTLLFRWGPRDVLLHGAPPSESVSLEVAGESFDERRVYFLKCQLISSRGVRKHACR